MAAAPAAAAAAAAALLRKADTPKDHAFRARLAPNTNTAGTTRLQQPTKMVTEQQVLYTDMLTRMRSEIDLIAASPEYKTALNAGLAYPIGSKLCDSHQEGHIIMRRRKPRMSGRYLPGTSRMNTLAVEGTSVANGITSKTCDDWVFAGISGFQFNPERNILNGGQPEQGSIKLTGHCSGVNVRFEKTEAFDALKAVFPPAKYSGKDDVISAPYLVDPKDAPGTFRFAWAPVSPFSFHRAAEALLANPGHKLHRDLVGGHVTSTASFGAEGWVKDHPGSMSKMQVKCLTAIDEFRGAKYTPGAAAVQVKCATQFGAQAYSKLLAFLAHTGREAPDMMAVLCDAFAVRNRGLQSFIHAPFTELTADAAEATTPNSPNRKTSAERRVGCIRFLNFMMRIAADAVRHTNASADVIATRQGGAGEQFDHMII